MTGTPAARAAAATALTFSTTFWLAACAGAPESANAPPSPMTSFCRSWMMSAVRARSRLTGLSSVVGKAGRGHLRLDAVHGRRRGDEQRPPAGAAPAEVADVLGRLDHAEMLARRVEHPHAAGSGDPDVAALVALHPVDDAVLDHA